SWRPRSTFGDGDGGHLRPLRRGALPRSRRAGQPSSPPKKSFGAGAAARGRRPVRKVCILMGESTSVLDRYRDLVDDFAAFEEASRAPLPRVVWAHPERITPGALRERLEAAGLRVTPLALPGALRVDGTTHPGRLLEYRLGLCHTQEA